MAGEAVSAGPSVSNRQYPSSAGIWLGLFAMLMIHAGPLFSALQAAASPQPPPVVVVDSHPAHGHDPHVHHGHHGHYASHAVADHGAPHGMHHRSTPGEPAWLAALEMCGYCELLTLNPPLSLSLQLLLSEYRPTVVLPLPEAPRPPAPRRSSGHPRAPPLLHS